MDQRTCSRHRKLGGQGPQCFNECLAEVNAVAVAPAHPTPKLPKVRRAMKVRKVAAVSDAKSAVSDGATRTARWRGKQDPEVLKQRNRDAVQRCRAKKAGKGKV
jgi:hypothetical protein